MQEDADVQGRLTINTWTAHDLSQHYVMRVPHALTTAIGPVGIIKVQCVTDDQVIDAAELSLADMESR